MVVFVVIWLYDLMLKAYSLKWPGIGSVRRRCTSNWLYWNPLVRLFKEIYMNLTLFTMVNIVSLEWDTELPAVTFCNVFSIVALIVVLTLPVFLIVHTSRNLRNFQKESFQKRHGAMFEGLELDVRKRD